MEQSDKDKWLKIRSFVVERFSKNPDMNALLFLIGMRELGTLKKKFTKEEKVKLFDLAIRRLLSPSGYYKLDGEDEKGWPIYVENEKVPYQNVFEQETFLRHHIIEYFESEELI